MTKQPMKFLIHALLLCAALLGSAGILASEKVTYFHNEPTGSAAMATDEVGNVAWKETYRPFGDRLVRATGAADNSVWYAGRHQEAGIGLSYLGARYYDAALGRFVSVDAAEVNPEDLHSFNRYAYANNNPYRYVDPDGNTPFDIAFLVYDIGKLGIAAYSGVGVGAAATDVGISALSLFSPFPGAGQAVKAARVADKAVDGAKVVGSISPNVRALSEANITDNGITILGRFQAPPGQANYIQKATAGKYEGSSYFDLGNAWTPIEGRAANLHFLDIVGGRGDKIILSTPKGGIKEHSSLSMEVNYLQSEFGYRWVNQWSMKKN